MQGGKLYVGNLSYSVTNEDLEELFSKYGTVVSASVITDRLTGKAKGFGFVEMSSPAEAEKAKGGLDGSDFKERTLKVDEARPPKDRQRGGYRRY